jgi:hypothetical protein
MIPLHGGARGGFLNRRNPLTAKFAKNIRKVRKGITGKKLLTVVSIFT